MSGVYLHLVNHSESCLNLSVLEWAPSVCIKLTGLVVSCYGAVWGYSISAIMHFSYIPLAKLPQNLSLPWTKYNCLSLMAYLTWLCSLVWCCHLKLEWNFYLVKWFTLAVKTEAVWRLNICQLFSPLFSFGNISVWLRLLLTLLQ